MVKNITQTASSQIGGLHLYQVSEMVLTQIKKINHSG